MQAFVFICHTMVVTGSCHHSENPKLSKARERGKISARVLHHKKYTRYQELSSYHIQVFTGMQARSHESLKILWGLPFTHYRVILFIFFITRGMYLQSCTSSWVKSRHSYTATYRLNGNLLPVICFQYIEQ